MPYQLLLQSPLQLLLQIPGPPPWLREALLLPFQPLLPVASAMSRELAVALGLTLRGRPSDATAAGERGDASAEIGHVRSRDRNTVSSAAQTQCNTNNNT